MNRRSFIAASLMSAAAANYIKAENLLISSNQSESNLKLAGFSLEELLDQYNYYLFEDFLPFMDKYIIDHKYGGFMCNADRDGTRINSDKNTWYEGRGIWVYSFLYRNFGKNEKHLNVARKSIELISKTKPAGNELWVVQISREGKPITPPAVRIYGDVFVAEGLSEFARATGEMSYWEMAKEIILKCWKIYNQPDYYPNAIADYSGPEVFPFPGAKIQGVSMVMIVAIKQMLEIKNDPELEKIISECVDAVITKHFNPEFRLNNELLNHDYSRPENELAQFVYTGHAIETFWPIMKEAIRRNDIELFKAAAERFKRHVEITWDDVYGGVFRSLNHVNKNLWEIERVPKVLWAQQETLNGIMMLIEQLDDEWAKNWFDKVYNYMVDKYFLKQYGYPLWITAANRKVTFEPHYSRIENYHLPRHLMLTLLSLEKIKENNGKPAWKFNNE